MNTPNAPRHPQQLLTEERRITDADFTGMDLRGLFHDTKDPYEFTDCVFTEANLRGAQLPEASFTNCTLDEADLTGAMLEQARFIGGSGARLTAVDADLADTRFEHVDLANTRWNGALLAGTTYTDSRLVGARFTEHRGVGYTFARCQMTMADLSGMSFRGEYLDHLILTEANLSGCDFTNAVFNGCRLTGAELRAATFTGADLRGADLGDLTPVALHALKGAHISVDQGNAILAAWGLRIIAE